MKGGAQNKSSVTAKEIINRILVSGQIDRQQYMLLTSAILSEQNLGDEDRRQINHIFDYIQMGRLKLVD